MKSNQIHMIIDGDNLYRDAVRLLGRGPHRHERLDYEGLLREAARLHGGESPVMAEYIQREHSGAGGFYHALNDMQYQLRLVPDEDGWEAQKLLVLSRLEALQQGDCDVLYVGGDSFNGKITSALRDLAVSPDGSERTVAVANFARLSEIDDPAFKQLDVVIDLNVVPPSYYRYSDQPTASPRDSLGSSPRPARTELATAPHQHSDMTLSSLPADVPAGIETPQTTAEAQPTAAMSDPAISEGVLDTARPPRSVLVLVDVENIDATLKSDFLCSDPSNSAVKPRWDAVSRFAADLAAGGPVKLIPVVQFRESQIGFVQFWRQGLGAIPIVLYTEDHRDQDARKKRRPVVDDAIIKVIAAIRERVCDVVIVSNDGGYFSHLDALRADGFDRERRFHVIGFADTMNRVYSQAGWVQIHDLQRDVGAFNTDLPRRFLPIAVDDLNAATLLGDFGLPAPPTPEHDDEAAGH